MPKNKKSGAFAPLVCYPRVRGSLAVIVVGESGGAVRYLCPSISDIDGCYPRVQLKNMEKSAFEKRFEKSGEGVDPTLKVYRQLIRIVGATDEVAKIQSLDLCPA